MDCILMRLQHWTPAHRKARPSATTTVVRLRKSISREPFDGRGKIGLDLLPVMVGRRLFLFGESTDDPERMAQAM